MQDAAGNPSAWSRDLIFRGRLDAARRSGSRRRDTAAHGRDAGALGPHRRSLRPGRPGAAPRPDLHRPGLRTVLQSGYSGPVAVGSVAGWLAPSLVGRDVHWRRSPRTRRQPLAVDGGEAARRRHRCARGRGRLGRRPSRRSSEQAESLGNRSPASAPGDPARWSSRSAPTPTATPSSWTASPRSSAPGQPRPGRPATPSTTALLLARPCRGRGRQCLGLVVDVELHARPDAARAAAGLPARRSPAGAHAQLASAGRLRNAARLRADRQRQEDADVDPKSLKVTIRLVKHHRRSFAVAAIDPAGNMSEATRTIATFAAAVAETGPSGGPAPASERIRADPVASVP